MIKSKGLKVFVVLIISTGFLIGFSQFGVQAYSTFLYKGTYEPGTKIGSVNVEGMSKQQAVTEIETELLSWFDNEYLHLSLHGESIIIGPEYFVFEFPKTVDSAVNGKENPIVVQVDQEVYEDGLLNKLKNNYNMIDHERIQAILIASVSTMSIGKKDISINEYIKENLSEKAAETSITSSFEHEQVQKVTDHLGNIVVPAQAQVSFLDLIKDTSKLSNEGVNLVASALYKALLLTNFVVIERHTSLELPNEIELGYEAFIEKGKSDLKWFNPNKTTYTISFELNDSGLFITVKGAPFLNTYQVIMSEQSSFPPKSIFRYTSLLAEGQDKVVQEGRDGLFIKIEREIYDTEGALMKTEAVSEDFYPPVHKVIETGLINRVQETETQWDETVDQSELSNTVQQSTDPSYEGQTTKVPGQGTDQELSTARQNKEQVQSKQNETIWETPANPIEK